MRALLLAPSLLETPHTFQRAFSAFLTSFGTAQWVLKSRYQLPLVDFPDQRGFLELLERSAL